MPHQNGHWRKVSYDTWDADGLVIRSKSTGDVVCEPNKQYEFIISVLPEILYALNGCSDWFGDNLSVVTEFVQDPEIAKEVYQNVERVYKLLKENQGESYLEIVK
jgi:hypothetical protein